MLLGQVKNYEIFRPKCDFSKEILHALATFDVDISPVFPYLNAELGGWDYDPDNQVLLLKLSAGKGFTLQRHEIAVKGARDIEESQALLEWIKGQINDIYERREEITPRYTGQAGLKVMEILKLLPMTNCRACGYATCMAFAAGLREGEISPGDFPPLMEDKYQAQREKLRAYLTTYGWRALDGSFEIYTWRANQLGNHDTLSSIYNESPLVGHFRKIAQEDILLHRLRNVRPGQQHGNVHRAGKGQVALDALFDGMLRFPKPVLQLPLF